MDKVGSELGHISLPKPFSHGGSKLEITGISSDGRIKYIYGASTGSTSVKDINSDILVKIVEEIKNNRYL